MSEVMDVAKVTSKGQVTIPSDVRKSLGIREGDKVLFIKMEDGSIVLKGSNLEAVDRAYQGFAGAAEKAGLNDDEDLTELIKEVRADRAKRRETR